MHQDPEKKMLGINKYLIDISIESYVTTESGIKDLIGTNIE